MSPDRMDAARGDRNTKDIAQTTMNKQPIPMRRITSDEDASFLMPGHGDEVTLVLFCGAGAPVVQRARELSTQVRLPGAWSLAVLDPQVARDTAHWFGVTELPAMGAVCDGALLAVEYECSLEAFERLIAWAKRQFGQL